MTDDEERRLSALAEAKDNFLREEYAEATALLRPYNQLVPCDSLSDDTEVNEAWAWFIAGLAVRPETLREAEVIVAVQSRRAAPGNLRSVTIVEGIVSAFVNRDPDLLRIAVERVGQQWDDYGSSDYPRLFSKLDLELASHCGGKGLKPYDFRVTSYSLWRSGLDAMRVGDFDSALPLIVDSIPRYAFGGMAADAIWSGFDEVTCLLALDRAVEARERYNALAALPLASSSLFVRLAKRMLDAFESGDEAPVREVEAILQGQYGNLDGLGYPGIFSHFREIVLGRERSRSPMTPASSPSQFAGPKAEEAPRAAGSARTSPEFPATFREFDVRLMTALDDVTALPTEGTSLIILADVRGVLHFRIFDAAGTRIVDTDEKRLPDVAQQIAVLRSRLATLWGIPQLSGGEREGLITAVTLIVRHTPFRYRFLVSRPAADADYEGILKFQSKHAGDTDIASMRPKKLKMLINKATNTMTPHEPLPWDEGLLFLVTDLYPSSRRLALVSSVGSPERIPGNLGNTALIAKVGTALHFRLFDEQGDIVAEGDEGEISPHRIATLNELKATLGDPWDLTRLSQDEQSRVISMVASLLGHEGASVRRDPVIAGRCLIQLGWGGYWKIVRPKRDFTLASGELMLVDPPYLHFESNQTHSLEMAGIQTHPAYERQALGWFQTQARVLFILLHHKDLESRIGGKIHSIYSNLLTTDDDGRYPFYEEVVRPLLGSLDYDDADDYRYQRWGIKSLILEKLLSDKPQINSPLADRSDRKSPFIPWHVLPPKLREGWGKTRSKTLPARRNLEKFHFKAVNKYDVLDGGQYVEIEPDVLSRRAERHEYVPRKVKERDLPEGAPYLTFAPMGRPMHDFQCARARAVVDGDDLLIIEDVYNALSIQRAEKVVALDEENLQR